MITKIKLFFPVPFIVLLFATVAFGQKSSELEKLVYKADKYYKIRNYSEALPLYKQVIDAGLKEAPLYYKLAACYQGSHEVNDRIQSIPYFEKALTAKGDLPDDTYMLLGDVYLEDMQIQKALDAYDKYRPKLNPNNKPAKERLERKVQVATNALSMLSSKKDIKITSLGKSVNTKYTEYNPVVSADEGVMAFTALRPNTGKTRPGDKFIEEIYITYNTSGAWSIPEKIGINSNYNVGTAGISADGQEMLIFIGGANSTGNIHSIKKVGDKWSRPTLLGQHVNSRSLETTASITPDGKIIYFASNRLKGYGGLDIYKVEKDEKGVWGRPVNLGAQVNTKYDDEAPFIHPDKRSLFFTSEGHNTMGGKDIFKTQLVKGKWTKPENMGYPINTTANDDYFTLTADGRKGYFSSDRKGGAGGQDIYSLVMPEEDANIPLTMLKGRILDAETMKPIPTKIYMIDVETNKKLDFVYHPDAETGNYLIILPPNKNYDMVIESEGYLPYTLNVHIPNQDYFYSLYQQIRLKTIKHFDVIVGQEVEVKNAFFDTYVQPESNLKKSHEAELIKTDSIDVYDLMNDLIAAGDKEGIDYLIELIYTTNPIDDLDFDALDKVESAKRIYYYDESDESKFEQKKIDGKTIFSLPTMHVAEEAQKQKNQKKVAIKYDKSLLTKEVKIYFGAGKSNLDAKYSASLNQVLDILKKHNQLGVEISGYASAEGNEEDNRKLSNNRAISVLDYINKKGIVRRRIIAKGFGETKNEEASKEESRRVEIKVVDLEEAYSKISK